MRTLEVPRRVVARRCRARRGAGLLGLGELAFFFPRQCALDTAGMYRETELALDNAGKFARMQCGIRGTTLFDEGHDLGGKLVGALGSASVWQQPGDPRPGKRGFGLIERGARYPIHLGSLDLACALVCDLSQHLVLDLHEIGWVEEAAGLEVRGTYALGVAVE